MDYYDQCAICKEPLHCKEPIERCEVCDSSICEKCSVTNSLYIEDDECPVCVEKFIDPRETLLAAKRALIAAARQKGNRKYYWAVVREINRTLKAKCRPSA